MNLNTVRNIIFFVILLVVQALVLNHIHLFGYATPLLYVYFPLTLRSPMYSHCSHRATAATTCVRRPSRSVYQNMSITQSSAS